MTLRRLTSGVLAGAAVVGLPLLSGGVASATESGHPHGDAGPDFSHCSAADGTATGSPGVASGNVVQAPVLNCGEVNVIRF